MLTIAALAAIGGCAGPAYNGGGGYVEPGAYIDGPAYYGGPNYYLAPEYDGPAIGFGFTGGFHDGDHARFRNHRHGRGSHEHVK